MCEPYRALIERALGEGLSAQRIHQDLQIDHAFAGSYESVKRFVRQLAPVLALPFRRMESAPGEQMQVDFGQGAPVIMRRYENRSTIMTSNRPLEDWGKLLQDVPTAGAILDRFLHHAHVIAITGQSYRMKNAASARTTADANSS